MATDLKSFFDALNREEAVFVPKLASDSLGVWLRCAINELDWYCYNLIRSEAPTEEQREHYYIMQLGACRLIQQALDARPSFDVPTLTFQRHKEMAREALEMVSALGIVQHGRRVAQTVALGMGRIERVQEKHFRITLPSEVPDYDYHERAVLQHYISASRAAFAENTRSDTWKELEAYVDATLSELVYPWANHFMGYGADPLLDQFFFNNALHEIQLHEGFDTFRYDAQFAGVRFQSYVLALAFLMSTNFKHERFAEALVQKDSNIRLEDILTVSTDCEALIETIYHAVNNFGGAIEHFEEISLDDARTVFRVLCCGRGSSILVAAPGAPLPLLVQTSDSGVIKCLTGAHSEPVRFMLESLRHHCQRDYDTNQQGRETSLQRAVQRVLGEAYESLEFRQNVSARRDGKELTDIDLVILEKRTGIVILCQLKHQDLYGTNLHAKRIRGDRLRTQVVDWLAALKEWQSALNDSVIRDSLRVPRGFPPQRVRRLIISRHFSYPLKDVITDEDVVYTTWVQFVNAIELTRRQYAEPSLEQLLGSLRDLQRAPEIMHKPEPITTWTINDLSFTTQQAADCAEREVGDN